MADPTPTFEQRDPAAPSFWNERFRQQFTPWDMGGVPAALQHFVAQQARPRATLIPGCGNGYELAFLSDAGWEATAIDFAPEAVASARRAVGRWAGRVHEADFFAFGAPHSYELVYERAFLCALPRALRGQVALRWSQLLPPGGLLAGFFYFDDAPKGPPFGIAAAELDALLTPHFERIDDQPVTDSIPVFAGKERWQVWRRLG